MKILVVDEEGQRKLLKLFLSREGYEVFEGETEEEAWELIGLQDPNLLIMDMGRPGQVWPEKFVKRVKECFPKLPVIITGTDLPLALERRNKGIGADAFFSKPYKPSELREKILELCS